MEAVLLLISAFLVQIFEIQLKALFHMNREILMVGALAGSVTAGSGFLLLFLADKLGDQLEWLKTLKSIVLDELVPLFKPLNFLDIILIAISSGFCEEVFFRGVVQREIGLWLGDHFFQGIAQTGLGVLTAAILFGALHCPSPRYLPYGFWALAAGIFLGWLLLITNSLWTPIVAHSLSNLIVLLVLRYKHI
jgi:membrane protease YdiL (CAAX protease family)